MSEFTQLQDYVAAGDIHVVQIDAVPRSLSTALGRALAEGSSNSIYVNEPINKLNKNLDVAASTLLAAAATVNTIEGPPTIITKSIGRSFNAGDFERWTSACNAVAWCIRDPRIQIASLATRVANDRLVGRGADTLSSEDLYAALPIVTERLSEENFAKAGWAAVKDHYQSVTPSKRGPVIDGEELSRHPETTLRCLCTKLGLKYDDRMVGGWGKNIVNANTYSTDRYDKNGLPSSS
jgi:hypothetical protein